MGKQFLLAPSDLSGKHVRKGLSDNLDQSFYSVHGRRYSAGTPLLNPSLMGWGRGGISNFLSVKNIQVRPLLLLLKGEVRLRIDFFSYFLYLDFIKWTQ